MIAEGIVTTIGSNGELNIAPMGPIVSGDFEQLVLRPFPTSRTYANLRATERGIFHVTDDVELLVRAALDMWDPAAMPAVEMRTDLGGSILVGACRWYAFHVARWDESGERPRLECPVLERGWQRDFWGFNRAKHAVLEAAILASRVRWLPRLEIEQDMERLRVIVDKTAGQAERRALGLVENYLAAAFTSPQSSS